MAKKKSTTRHSTRKSTTVYTSTGSNGVSFFTVSFSDADKAAARQLAHSEREYRELLMSKVEGSRVTEIPDEPEKPAITRRDHALLRTMGIKIFDPITDVAWFDQVPNDDLLKNCGNA